MEGPVTNVIVLDDERRKRRLPPPVLDALAIALGVSVMGLLLGLMGFFTAMMIAGSK